MSFFTALVIIPQSTLNVEVKIEELMQLYDSKIEVEPYKEYLSQEVLTEEINYLKSLSQKEIDEIAKEWEVEANNLEELAKCKLEWFDEIIDGVDENGEYKITNVNPNSKWDWYRFVDMEGMTSRLFVRHLHTFAVKEIEFVPYAVVTPDGKWHKLGAKAGIESFVNREIRKKEVISEDDMKWTNKVKQIKSNFQDYLVVILHCHC